MLTAALAFRIAHACFSDCSSACGPISPCELAFIPDSPRALGLGLHMLMQLPPYAYAGVGVRVPTHFTPCDTPPLLLLRPNLVLTLHITRHLIYPLEIIVSP